MSSTVVPYFRGVNLVISEGERKSVFVGLSDNTLLRPSSVQVYVATLARYEEELIAEGSQCKKSLSDLNLNLSLLDSAEGI